MNFEQVSAATLPLFWILHSCNSNKHYWAKYMYYSVNEWNLVIFDAAVEKKKKKIDSL